MYHYYFISFLRASDVRFFVSRPGNLSKYYYLRLRAKSKQRQLLPVALGGLNLNPLKPA